MILVNLPDDELEQYAKKEVLIMLCMGCGAIAEKGYTADVVQQLEKIVDMAKQEMIEWLSDVKMSGSRFF